MQSSKLLWRGTFVQCATAAFCDILQNPFSRHLDPMRSKRCAFAPIISYSCTWALAAVSTSVKKAWAAFLLLAQSGFPKSRVAYTSGANIGVGTRASDSGSPSARTWLTYGRIPAGQPTGLRQAFIHFVCASLQVCARRFSISKSA